MKNVLSVHLATNPEQTARLHELQVAFAQVCNALAPLVQQTRCWNRVGLHHLAYRSMRERFPQLGSQMICNAIYSVSRTCRRVYREPDKGLPLLLFLPTAPVYFDRHTLSIKNGQLSMFTLDGRMRFHLGLAEADLQRFADERLREIILSRGTAGYFLHFVFAVEGEGDGEEAEMPHYVVVLPPEEEGGSMRVTTLEGRDLESAKDACAAGIARF